MVEISVTQVAAFFVRIVTSLAKTRKIVLALGQTEERSPKQPSQ
jgi:hypothetical protein